MLVYGSEANTYFGSLSAPMTLLKLAMLDVPAMLEALAGPRSP